MPPLKIRTYIGQNIYNEKRNLTIIDQEIREINPYTDKNGLIHSCNSVFVRVKCNICGWDEKWIQEKLLFSKNGAYCCACCAGAIVIKGINDIATTNPEFVKYFYNVEDAYTHCIKSKKVVKFICPVCKEIIERKISSLTTYRMLNCPKCGDGHSIPEKFVYAFLKESGIDFIYQLSQKNFKWCGRYFYDFYVPSVNMIIEVNGKQHYVTVSFSHKKNRDERKNDINKIKLARDNGISIYSVIPAEKSTFEYLYKAISDSKLLEILNIDIHNIDMKKCYMYAISNKVTEVCEYYNTHPFIGLKEIAKIFKYNITTIQGYLRRGALYGLCDYQPMEHVKRIHSKRGKERANYVEIFKEGKSLGIYRSAKDLEERSKDEIGIELNRSNINKVCRGEAKSYKGFTFKRLTKGEYYDRSKNIS